MKGVAMIRLRTGRMRRACTGMKRTVSGARRSSGSAMSTKRRKPSRRSARQFVVCIRNTGYPASLELHTIYRGVPDAEATRDGDVRYRRRERRRLPLSGRMVCSPRVAEACQNLSHSSYGVASGPHNYVVERTRFACCSPGVRPTDGKEASSTTGERRHDQPRANRPVDEHRRACSRKSRYRARPYGVDCLCRDRCRQGSDACAVGEAPARSLRGTS